MCEPTAIPVVHEIEVLFTILNGLFFLSRAPQTAQVYHTAPDLLNVQFIYIGKADIFFIHSEALILLTGSRTDLIFTT